MYNVYIRPLQSEDARTSWKWRNDQEIWKFTGTRPDQVITYEIENNWIIKVLSDDSSKRFAIIADNVYVGNIQLTNIDSISAQYHVFIGDKNYWGKGIAQLATFQILNYAKEILNLKEVYLHVNTDNLSAITVYEKNGFERQNQIDTELKMVCILEKRPNPTVSIFCMVYNHEKYIAECLEGFLFQKCNFNYTIILGEDCSTDSSRNIILDYVKRYPGKFKLLLHNENIGAIKNQELVFKNCHDKYIALCEGDDYWTDPLKLQKQVDFLESNRSVVACGGYVDVYFFDDFQNSNIVSDKIILTKNNDLYYRHPFATLTLMFRNENINELLDYEFVVGDVDLFHYLSKFGDFALLPYKFGVYRFHGNGANSGNNHFFNKRKQINAVVKVSNTFSISNYRSNLRKKLIREIFNNLKNLRHGDVKNNLEYSFFCIKTLISKT